MVTGGGGGGGWGFSMKVLGEKRGENMCFTVLDVFVAYKTRPGKILVAWASWPKLDLPGRVLGEFTSNIFYCFCAMVISHAIYVILQIPTVKT